LQSFITSRPSKGYDENQQWWVYPITVEGVTALGDLNATRYPNVFPHVVYAYLSGPENRLSHQLKHVVDSLAVVPPSHCGHIANITIYPPPTFSTAGGYIRVSVPGTIFINAQYTNNLQVSDWEWQHILLHEATHLKDYNYQKVIARRHYEGTAAIRCAFLI